MKLVIEVDEKQIPNPIDMARLIHEAFMGSAEASAVLAIAGVSGESMGAPLFLGTARVGEWAVTL